VSRIREGFISGRKPQLERPFWGSPSRRPRRCPRRRPRRRPRGCSHTAAMSGGPWRSLPTVRRARGTGTAKGKQEAAFHPRLFGAALSTSLNVRPRARLAFLAASARPYLGYVHLSPTRSCQTPSILHPQTINPLPSPLLTQLQRQPNPPPLPPLADIIGPFFRSHWLLDPFFRIFIRTVSGY
jgi:hypothetical protein